MLNWLLIFVPSAIALEHFAPQHHLLVFLAAALAILPLAGWMGHATEQLAERTGEDVGGLLNATFGNAAELIIALAALSAGLHDVVKASIAGSIVGNILLVLGAAILTGGFVIRSNTSTHQVRAHRPPYSLSLLSRLSCPPLIKAPWEHAFQKGWDISAFPFRWYFWSYMCCSWCSR
jgi:Ca2+:H+ antiporter